MTLKVDKSLAEVLKWREELQKATEPMSPEKQMAYIRQKVQDFMRQYNILPL